eukprot:1705068-Prymnesium_polylepis.1
MARVVSCERSSRPVTGAPRLAVRIVAEDSFEVAADTLVPTDGGFLMGRAAATTSGPRSGGTERRSPPADADGDEQGDDGCVETRVVCVVGLAHANGVLERCAAAGLEPDALG